MTATAAPPVAPNVNTIGARGQAARRVPSQIQGMEGGLLIHAAWLLSFTFVWIYRRWFETVAPRDAAFEALCAERPALAVARVRPGAEEAALARLRAGVPRGELIATLGGWPWIHYVLGVTPEKARGAVVLRITSCRVLRSQEERPPAAVAVLVELFATGAVDELWLHPGAYVDVRGRTSAPRGWRVRASGGRRPSFEPTDAPPPETAPAATTTSVARLIAVTPVPLAELPR